MADNAPLTVTVRTDTTDLEKGLSAAMRASQREVDALKKKIDGMTSDSGARVKQLGSTITQSFKQQSFAVQQLRFQVNDVVTSLASGANAAQVFAQQAGQIGQAFGGLSVRAGLGALLASIASPLSLMTIGVTVASAAWAHFAGSSEDAAAAQKRQADALNDIVSKFGDLVPHLKAYADAQQAAADATEAAAAAAGATAGAYKPTKDAIEALTKRFYELANVLADASNIDAALKLGDAWDKLQQRLEKGTATGEDVAAVQQQLADILNDETHPATEDLKAAIDLLNKALEAQKKGIDAAAAAAAGYADDAKAATKANKDFNAALDEMKGIAAPTLSDMEKLMQAYDRAVQAAEGDVQKLKQAHDELANGLDRIKDKAEEAYGSTAVSGLEDFAAKVAQAESGGDPNAKNPNSTASGLYQFTNARFLEVARMFDKYAALTDEQLLAQKDNVAVQKEIFAKHVELLSAALEKHGITITDANLYLAHFLGEAGAVRLLSAPRNAPAASNVSADALAANPTVLGGGKTVQDVINWATQKMGEASAAIDKTKLSYDELVVSINKQILAQENENAITGDSTLSTDAKTEALQREKAAQEAARVETELNNAAQQQGIELTDAVRARNHELAMAYAEAGLKAEQLGEAQKKAAESARTQAQEVAQFASQLASTIGSAVSGFISDLRAGKSAAEAFNNMINRIVDSLVNMAIQMLIVKPLTQGLTGLFGGGGAAPAFSFAEQGGVVGQIGTKRRANPLLWAGAPSFAAGGMVLPAGAVPIIAHQGERIIPKGGRLGGDVHQNIGSISVSVQAGPGQMAATTDQGKALGRMIDKSVQAILVRESRPGGILRKAPELRG